MDNNTKITTHRPLNPFRGKVFRISLYRGEEEVNSNVVTIESQSELKTILEDIKQFNNAQEEFAEQGNHIPLVKRLITE